MRRVRSIVVAVALLAVAVASSGVRADEDGPLRHRGGYDVGNVFITSLAVDSEHRVAYVATSGTAGTVAVDLATMTRRSGHPSPAEVVLLDTERDRVVTVAGAAVRILERSTLAEVQFRSTGVFRQFYGAALLPDDGHVVAFGLKGNFDAPTEKYLMRIDPDTGAVAAQVQLPEAAQIWSMAHNPATGLVYAADAGRRVVIALDPETLAEVHRYVPIVPQDDSWSGGPLTLDDIAVDPIRNRVYATEFSNDQLIVLDGDDLSQIEIVMVQLTPREVAVDPARGRIFVADSNHAALTVVDSDTHERLAMAPISGYSVALEVDTVTGDVVAGFNWDDTRIDRYGFVEVAPPATAATVSSTGSVVEAGGVRWATGSWSATLACDDGTGSGCATTWVRRGSSPATTYGGEVISLSDEGRLGLSYWSEDHNGNVEAARSTHLGIDRSAPHVAWLTQPGAVVVGALTSSQVKAAAFDAVLADGTDGAGLAGVCFEIDRVWPWRTPYGCQPAVAVDGHWAPGMDLTTGYWDLTPVATDHLGHQTRGDTIRIHAL